MTSEIQDKIDRVGLADYEVGYLRFLADEYKEDGLPPITIIRRTREKIGDDAELVGRLFMKIYTSWLGGDSLNWLTPDQEKIAQEMEDVMDILVFFWKEAGGRLDMKRMLRERIRVEGETIKGAKKARR